MSEGGFFVTEDSMSANLEFLASQDLDESAQNALLEVAMDVEDAARYNAPWHDITGDARAGLSVDLGSEGNTIVLTLSHAVDYGYWLETIQSGRYAIIMPTLEQYASEIMNSVGAHVTGVETSY